MRNLVWSIALRAREMAELGAYTHRDTPYKFVHNYERIERLPVLIWYDVSDSQDGSRRIYIHRGRGYYYIRYWTNYLYCGQPVDWCVRVPVDSDIGREVEAIC